MTGQRRRLLLSLGALAAAPLAARAQQSGTRRIGVLMGWAEKDLDSEKRLASLQKGLAALGWVEGRNLRLDVRWAAADVDRAAVLAKELVASRPDVLLSTATPPSLALQKETSTIPIVFTVVSDPVGSGLVKTLARPGGNITGFVNLEASLVEKWLQLLKEIAPKVTRAGVMFNPRTAPYVQYYLRPLEKVAANLGVKTFPATVGSDADIERVVAGLGREPGGGLIALTDSFLNVHRKALIGSAARHKVPTIYFNTFVVAEGALIAYGVDTFDLMRRSAEYVDRILRGANPAELPVQQPQKFELMINLKTAKALGLAVPSTLRLRADRVIE
jgi:putative ABC transport system substrate-binding protein